MAQATQESGEQLLLIPQNLPVDGSTRQPFFALLEAGSQVAVLLVTDLEDAGCRWQLDDENNILRHAGGGQTT